jgi:serine/threonine protein kinase
VTGLAPGAVLGGYRIEDVVGHGGMGIVYRATQLRLDRTVAIKVIMPELASDPLFRERFERESMLAASIDHRNVVPVHEAGEVDGVLFIAMRFVDGGDLRAVIESEGAVAPRRAAWIIAEVASALDAAHARGLVHRDVKPGNIMVAGSGDEEHVYLTDFGLTKRMSDRGMTRTGQWVGTLDYAAPEQIDNRPIDARTDVYALGCVLYETVTGQVPFVRDSDVAKMYAHLNEPAPRLRDIRTGLPEALGDAIERAMSKEPDGRFPSAGDFGRAALAGARGAEGPTTEHSVATGDAAPAPATVTRPSPQPRSPTPPTQAVPVFAQTPVTSPPPRSNRGLIAAIAVLMAIVVAGGTAFALGAFDSGGDEPSGRQVATTPTATAPATRSAQPTASASPEPSPTPPSQTFASYTGPAFQAQLPTDGGWSAPAQSEPTPGELFRTSVRGPGGMFVIIDYTPLEPARFGGDFLSSREVGQTAFGSATRYVFQGGTLPECQRSRCVDYIINDAATGSGFGVLVGGPDYSAVSELAQIVAESVVPS